MDLFWLVVVGLGVWLVARTQAVNASGFNVRVGGILGVRLSPEGVQLALAMAGVETHYGVAGSCAAGASFNYWNVTKGSWQGPTVPGPDAGSVNPIQNWRVYASEAQAVADWLDLVERVYPEAWAALQLGDAGAFVDALYLRGYFEVDPSWYLAQVYVRLAELRLAVTAAP